MLVLIPPLVLVPLVLVLVPPLVWVLLLMLLLLMVLLLVVLLLVVLLLLLVVMVLAVPPPLLPWCTYGNLTRPKVDRLCIELQLDPTEVTSRQRLL